MKKALVAGLLALFPVLLFSAPSQAATLRINQPRIELELAPGETFTGEFQAENPSEDEVKVKLYVEDWLYMPGGKGEKQFLPIGSSPLSSGKWITYAPSEEMMQAFGRLTVRYTVKVPEDARGGYYSVLFLETALGIVQDEEGANVLVSGRIGALFFIRVKGTTDKKGEISDVQIKAPEGNKPLEIATTFANTGNVDVTCGGNFLIMDAEENVAARGTLDSIYTFPGAVETVTTQWVGRLAPGKYQVLLTYDLGKGQSLVEERALTV